MRDFDLEAIRSVLADDSLHILLGIVEQVVVSPDRSTCRVMLSILPEKRQIIAVMSWEAVGAETGFFVLPNVGDMVLVAQAEGSADHAYVIKRLTSVEEKIPLNVLSGDAVLKAIGKQIWLTSDTRINLSKSDSSPSENLVLGQQLKSLLQSFMTSFINHTHIGNLGYNTAPPSTAQDVSGQKSSQVDNSAILSNIAFTEKG